MVQDPALPDSPSNMSCTSNIELAELGILLTLESIQLSTYSFAYGK